MVFIKLQGHPGNNEYPPAYMTVRVTTLSRGLEKVKRTGQAYWSGRRWIGVRGFLIGYAKVIKWEVQ